MSQTPPPDSRSSDLLRMLEGMLPKEQIGPWNLDDFVELVDLSIAFTPVVWECLGGNDHPWDSTLRIPQPRRVIKEGERYCVMLGRDYEWTTARPIQRARARYLLLRGWYWQIFDRLSNSVQREVVALYFGGAMWRPARGTELAKAMGLEDPE